MLKLPLLTPSHAKQGSLRCAIFGRQSETIPTLSSGEFPSAFLCVAESVAVSLEEGGQLWGKHTVKIMKIPPLRGAHPVLWHVSHFKGARWN